MTSSAAGFHYDKDIDGSIASMVDAYNSVNIHKLKHINIHPTQSYGSTQIDFIFISAAATEFVFHCGILEFNTLLSSDHIPLYIDIDILRILGYPVQGTIKDLVHDLKLHDPRLIDILSNSY
jgi:hypothetical protein